MSRPKLFGKKKPKKYLLHFFIRAIHFGLPILLMYLILRRIHWDQLERHVMNANYFLILMGTLMLVPTVALGALRWHFLIQHYNCASLSIGMAIREYWKSLALGVLAPGSLGSDAYRVVVPGRQTGRYLRSSFVIVVEKLAALFACAVLIIIFYPLLEPIALPSAAVQAFDDLYVFFLVGILCILLLFILAQKKIWMKYLADSLNKKLESLLSRIAAKVPHQQTQEDMLSVSGLSLMLSVFTPSIALPLVAFSLLICFLPAIQAQIFFKAFDYEIPFFANLFVTPLLVMLYALPISFGGIGVREGAFILAYGAFGVPSEISLAISFTGLFGNIISYGIGAGLFLKGDPLYSRPSS